MRVTMDRDNKGARFVWLHSADERTDDPNTVREWAAMLELVARWMDEKKETK